MNNTLFYQFNTLKIMIKTNSEGAQYFLDEYVLFEKAEESADNDITVEFYENSSVDEFIDEIPKDCGPAEKFRRRS